MTPARRRLLEQLADGPIGPHEVESLAELWRARRAGDVELTEDKHRYRITDQGRHALDAWNSRQETRP